MVSSLRAGISSSSLIDRGRLMPQWMADPLENADNGCRNVAGFSSERWPASNRNGGRLQLGTPAGFASEYPAGLDRNPHPIDTIKIDRSFVRDLAENAQDRAIATAIISMGKALGLTVVAEGVETTEQDAFLRGHSCDELQGFLFSKPVPADDVPALLRSVVPSPSLQPEFRPIKRRKHILRTEALVSG
jgi:hypothetical protein